MGSALPDSVRSSIDTWLAHHDRLAPGLIEGLYLVGSVAFDDTPPCSTPRSKFAGRASRYPSAAGCSSRSTPSSTTRYV